MVVSGVGRGSESTFTICVGASLSYSAVASGSSYSENLLSYLRGRIIFRHRVSPSGKIQSAGLGDKAWRFFCPCSLTWHLQDMDTGRKLGSVEGRHRNLAFAKASMFHADAIQYTRWPPERLLFASVLIFKHIRSSWRGGLCDATGGGGYKDIPPKGAGDVQVVRISLILNFLHLALAKFFPLSNFLFYFILLFFILVGALCYV